MPLHILIADDDQDDLELLEEALTEAQPDAVVFKVNGGAAAIDLLNTNPDSSLPDLVVLDYNMPEVTGSDVLCYLSGQERYNGVPRVIFSTSDAPRHMAECLKNGATKYFVKPKTKRELDEITSQMLALASH